MLDLENSNSFLKSTAFPALHLCGKGPASTLFKTLKEIVGRLFRIGWQSVRTLAAKIRIRYFKAISSIPLQLLEDDQYLPLAPFTIGLYEDQIFNFYNEYIHPDRKHWYIPRFLNRQSKRVVRTSISTNNKQDVLLLRYYK